jgi:hypothetical protein
LCARLESAGTHNPGTEESRPGLGILKSVAYDGIGNITNKSDLADTCGGTRTRSYLNTGNPFWAHEGALHRITTSRARSALRGSAVHAKLFGFI